MLKDLDEIYTKDWMTQVGKEETDSANIMMDSLVSELNLKEKLAEGLDILDFGSGPANMVNRLKEKLPASRILAIDGTTHAKEFVAPGIRFQQMNFTKMFSVQSTKRNWKFDLILCLEVLEHIDGVHEATVVKNLTRHMANSGYLIASAAPPFQAGNHHVNCKPKQYWIQKLEAEGIKYQKDLTEKLMGEWKEAGVLFYFWQNLMVFKR